MFLKLARHRKFEYTPRKYDPNKEDREKPNFNFQQFRNRRKTRPFIWLLALFIFVIYLIIALSKIAYNF
ncbi:MAG: hypothetical protein P8048_06725 [Calditrichia bacterium]